MKVCALCGNAVDVDRSMSRKETCRKCGGDLHICLNCRFHSPSAHNQCIETKAEQQRYRDKANFCDYFQYRDGGSARGTDGGGSAADDAKRKLDELFGGKG